MATQETCYMCDLPSTSKEHAPPRCIFPESKDVDGNYRGQLVTVPSCDEHNSRKSSDDEFLMLSLAGIIGNNLIGYKHKFTKVRRALKRSSLKIFDKVLKNQQVEWFEFSPNKFIDVIWGTPDFERLSNCFDRIARAVFFDTFATKFLGKTKVTLGFTDNKYSNPIEFQRMIRDKVQEELTGKPLLGANPEIFQYQFTDADEFGLRVAYLKFYGGLDVYVALIPVGFERPKDLVSELLDMGIPTAIRTTTGIYRYNFDPNSYPNNAE